MPLNPWGAGSLNKPLFTGNEPLAFLGQRENSVRTLELAEWHCLPGFVAPPLPPVLFNAEVYDDRKLETKGKG